MRRVKINYRMQGVRNEIAAGGDKNQRQLWDILSKAAIKTKGSHGTDCRRR